MAYITKKGFRTLALAGLVFFGYFAFLVPTQAGSFGVFLSPNPSIVAPGGSSTITWTVAWGNTPKLPYTCSSVLGNITIDSDPGGGAASGSVVVSVGSTTNYVLTCIAGDGEEVQSNVATITASGTPVVSVSASPSDVPVGGGSVIVSWTVGQATSCTPSDGTTAWKALTGMQTGGALQFAVSSPTTFTLTCSNPAGVSTSGGVTVTVGGTLPPPPPEAPGCGNYKVDPGEECDSVIAGPSALGPCPAVCSKLCTLNNCPVENPTGWLSADKNTVKVGEAVTLNWDIKKGDAPYSCNMVSGDPNWNDGYASPSGSRTFVPSMGGVNAPGVYNYTLCSSVLFTPMFSVQIKVIDPPEINFQVETNPINPGSSTKLKWDVSNAPQGCSLYKDTVGGNPLWSGDPTTTKEFSVSPTKSTIYVLECYKQIISATNQIIGTEKAQRKVLVSVNGTPDPDEMVAKVTICASRLSLKSNDPDTSKRMTTIQWTSKDALYCSLSNMSNAGTSDPGFLGEPPSLSAGQNSFFPTSTTSYVVNCKGQNNKFVTKGVTVAVNGVGSPSGDTCAVSSDPGSGGPETPPSANTSCSVGTCKAACNTATESQNGTCNNNQGFCCAAKVATPPVLVLGSFKNPLSFNTVEDVLNSVWGFLQGVIVILSLIMIVIGAIVYMTAAGNDSKLSTGKLIITAALVGLALALAAPSFLKQIGDILGWSGTNGASVATAKTLIEILQSVLNFLLSVVGIIAIIMLVIGGLMYLTAAGDEDRIGTGKKIVQYSLIGIAVSLAALVIVTQVIAFFN